jgi:hypothetical protein
MGRFFTLVGDIRDMDKRAGGVGWDQGVGIRPGRVQHCRRLIRAGTGILTYVFILG